MSSFKLLNWWQFVMRLCQLENCTPFLYFSPPILVTSCHILIDFPTLLSPHSSNQAHHPMLAAPLPFSWEVWANFLQVELHIGLSSFRRSPGTAPRRSPARCCPTAGCPKQGPLPPRASGISYGFPFSLYSLDPLQLGEHPGIPRWAQCHPKGPH